MRRHRGTKLLVVRQRSLRTKWVDRVDEIYLFFNNEFYFTKEKTFPKKVASPGAVIYEYFPGY